jgi:TolB-like protein
MNQTGSTYSFGDFELDLTAYQLKRSGKSIRLERIPFDLLILLIKRPGELITREEIAANLWTEGQFQDFETGTNTAVRKLRIALQDDAEKPRFIETAVGRGYRFIAPVEVHRATAPISAATTSPAPSPGVMLAVLPFINLTGDRSQDYFSDGMTEELITQLGRSDGTGLGVIARTSVMPYANTHTPVRQIARELKVDYVLEGSARRKGRAVRITAQLIRASDETHLWAKNFDRDIRSVLTLQREVAEAIEREILARITNRPGRAYRGTSVDGEAYDLYLQGRRHWNM